MLLVEDEAVILLDLKETFASAGFDTATASRGEEAIALLDTKPDIRALVTDVNLGGALTGWDVARRAREIYPDLPVVYVTSLLADEWTSKGVPQSVLISKPFTPVQVITAVAQLLNASAVPQNPA